VPLIAAASTWVCVLAEVPPDGVHPLSWEVIEVEVLFERVAGLDIGKESLCVCVRTPGPGGRRMSQTRTFKTTTRSLVVMRDWLTAAGVTIAAMESTSTYWKAPFYCLEEVMEVWLLNAAHMKAVPGRKTDVRDAEWIAQLLEHGLLRPSFPPGAHRRHRPVLPARSGESEGLRERYLPEVGVRVRVEHRNSQYALCAAARMRGGLQPDLSSDAGWWQTPLWQYAAYAVLVHSRVAAERLAVPLQEVTRRIAVRRHLDLPDAGSPH
jgi:hypothetical protein